ncbi:MAG TPA: hypothetical protein VGH72_07545 [Pseudonocardia sp.]|jgi:hypothetical protein
MPTDFSNTTRWRYGARDDAARTAHTAGTVAWRRSIAEAIFGATEQETVFAALRAGLTLTQAAKALDLTTNAIYGRARWDHAFRDQLEEVLDETCPAGDYCGRPAGVKFGGHCRSCREAHHPPR